MSVANLDWHTDITADMFSFVMLNHVFLIVYVPF